MRASDRAGAIGPMATVNATGTPEVRATSVDRSSEEHRRTDFPHRFRNEEPADVDLALRDACLIGANPASRSHLGGA